MVTGDGEHARPSISVVRRIPPRRCGRSAARTWRGRDDPARRRRLNESLFIKLSRPHEFDVGDRDALRQGPVSVNTDTTRFAIPARALLALCLAPILACSALGLDPGPAKEGDLFDAERRWARQQMASYRYTYASSCGMCPTTGPAVVDVHNGLVTAARRVGESDPLPMTQIDAILTVPDLFALIARALHERADALEVTYHPTLGHPLTVAIDWQFGTADDELWYSVDGLQPLTTSPP